MSQGISAIHKRREERFDGGLRSNTSLQPPFVVPVRLAGLGSLFWLTMVQPSGSFGLITSMGRPTCGRRQTAIFSRL